MNARTRSAIVTTVLHALVGYALLTGFGVIDVGTIPSVLAVIDLPPPPPPPRIETPLPRPKTARRVGAASPPNRRSTPTEIVTPPPVVPLPPPPRIVTANLAGAGRDATAGSAEVDGPGTGAGGIGTGTGSGGNGDGYGDGGFETPPIQRGGRIRNSDYPAAAAAAGARGRVSVKFLVRTDGRVGSCLVTRSSGNVDLDDTTCRLIRERFRYAPSRDARGQPVDAYLVEDHDWFLQIDR